MLTLRRVLSTYVMCLGRNFVWTESHPCIGRAIAQAVSCWLPTASARVRAWVWSSGMCGGQNGAWTGLLRVLWFPQPIVIPPNSPSSQSSGAGTIGQKCPTCWVAPAWTPPPTMQIKKIIKSRLFTWLLFFLSLVSYGRVGHSTCHHFASWLHCPQCSLHLLPVTHYISFVYAYSCMPKRRTGSLLMQL
jgi:hypothetical protein